MVRRAIAIGLQKPCRARKACTWVLTPLPARFSGTIGETIGFRFGSEAAFVWIGEFRRKQGRSVDGEKVSFAPDSPDKLGPSGIVFDLFAQAGDVRADNVLCFSLTYLVAQCFSGQLAG